ncbi:MAG: glutamate--cysteine ligase, partial [Gammaproteobacteria bacterium]
MGQEIERTRFTEEDFARFRQRLETETELLARWLAEDGMDEQHIRGGYEIEAWLIDAHYCPAPRNREFLDRFASPLASPELARFNVEFNSSPQPLDGSTPAFTASHRELTGTLQRAREIAAGLDCEILMTGILPTLRPEHLGLEMMSDMKRYAALNEQVLAARRGQPLHLEIQGEGYLSEKHENVMLESAATSFQLHLQIPARRAHLYYNAAMIASAATVGAAANSPYLFGIPLWDETRIPLFEQAVEVGGYEGAWSGPLHRVSFGSGYARNSILEVFRENLEHFPPLLPIVHDAPPERMEHLRLHNGTIWRWNRPLIGFDEHGLPHIRIEHRVMPAGPSLRDMIANAAFSYGLIEALVHAGMQELLPFDRARDNFHAAARHGLRATVEWPERGRVEL